MSSSTPLPERPEETVVLRLEEEARVGKRWRGAGLLRARRRLERVPVEAELPVGVERLVQARVPVQPGDSGRIETLPDGSISIPVFEEELVVTKRTVLRERVVIAKELVSELRVVHDTIRVEHVELDPDPGIEVRAGP